MNLDGETKRNRGPTGLGGVLRDDTSAIIFIFFVHLGNSTNNAMEFDGLIKGLHVSHLRGYTNLIVEGDSSVIIQEPSQLRHECLKTNKNNNMFLDG